MYEYKAKLVRAVDGDTIDVEIDLGFYVFSRQRIRLLGVDTPERGESNYAEATQFVVDWFARNGGWCVLQTTKAGKFGRWLGMILPNSDADHSLNQELIGAGLASRYED